MTDATLVSGSAVGFDALLNASPALVLVVARSERSRGALGRALTDGGLDVHLVADAATAERAGYQLAPDAVVLHVDVVDQPVIGRLASRHLLVAVGDTHDQRLAAVEAGADAALAWVETRMLAAQVRALLRRARRWGTSVRRLGDVVVDVDRAELRCGDTVVPLTVTEGSLLGELLGACGRPLSKAELLASVWEGDSYDPNLVEVHISHLRRKLRRCGDPLIETVRGRGYVLRLPPELPPGTARRGVAARAEVGAQAI